MSDLTVYAEALISAVARAFYDDDAVCLIDVLLRDKFLRDDDMGLRLSLPAKQLRRTLTFLQEEFLVKYENVDDLSEGGSQNTKFWYIDYNHAVNVIRLRIYMLKKKLQEAELRARSSSMYLCPGYAKKKCNGRYTETEAQQIVHQESCLFLCQECFKAHQNNPDPPPLETYTLQLIDNTKDLRAAMDNIRRVNVQLSAKMVGNQHIRVGIFDLLQKVRVKGKGPLSSNLPSENRACQIGSKRIAGTGRTAGIKAKKLREQGIVTPNAGGRSQRGNGATRSEEGSDLNFLKNARGEEIKFEVEKGGGARANLLAMRNRRKCKLMDAAASRVGVNSNGMSRKRKKASKEDEKKAENNGQLPGVPFFLFNNIGRIDLDAQIENNKRKRLREEEEEEDSEDEEEGDFSNMTEEERQKEFQKQYKIAMTNQRSLLQGSHGDRFPDTPMGNGVVTNGHAPRAVSDDGGIEIEDDTGIAWEDG
mmetsp:Transcript_26123/g.31622  ORF Transcript_26123/g.31622 Transcript_26123/m.31622 type:complete len:477 (+) Transcript_26123:57-1487(+)|eukprot:CAMPEP_0172513464 /NCGR_PEP_ID=MMETSP1066-20121228/252703_1 /TAXON_ID=671091 /ORGANISM="Coscinodiscus wailesii, Strain CCMP2513" /LENGTH=476 /DNA_ID=CAMNT_0013293741 /DNA_START=56 /DNA_END=1486 /DNA_ORIENTATION=+